MRSALPAVAVGALLVLAGCGGVNPIPDPDGPEATTTGLEETPYPPGVNESEVVSTSRLLAAHQDQIRETGARVEVNGSLVVSTENGPVALVSRVTVRSTPGLTRVHRVQVFDVIDDDGTVTTRRQAMYANETVVVSRRGDGDNATVDTVAREDRAELVERDVTRISALQEVLTGHDFRVVDTERRDGHTVTTLSADETVFTDDGTRRFHATLTVTSEGRILTLTVTRNPDTNTSVNERRQRITWSNGTTVEPPEWVP